MTPTHDDLERSLGRVEGSQSQMESRMDRFEKLVSEGFKELGDVIHELRKDIGDLKAKECERKGMWRIIALISGVVSAVVASIVKYMAG